jgi:hypothetical protein
MEFSTPKELTQIKESEHRAPFLDPSPLHYDPSRSACQKSGQNIQRRFSVVVQLRHLP